MCKPVGQCFGEALLDTFFAHSNRGICTPWDLSDWSLCFLYLYVVWSRRLRNNLSIDPNRAVL